MVFVKLAYAFVAEDDIIPLNRYFFHNFDGDPDISKNWWCKTIEIKLI